MKWSPSIRTKVVFYSLACVVLLGFLLTLATLYAVETRKSEIVHRAQELVQMRADHLREQLQKLLEEEKATDLDTLLRSERFDEVIRVLLRREDRVLVSLIYDHGERRLEYRVNPELAADIQVEAETVRAGDLAEARRSILRDGEPMGDVVVTYLPDVLLNQIHEESRQITQWLLALAAALAVLLAATFWLLWRVFRRHLARERAHERLDRMAYVGTLASGLAHEIRNPLNALSLNLDVIGEETADPRPESAERTRKILDRLKAEIGRLNSTLTSFLQLALPARHRLQMTDVVAVLHETASLLQPDMRQRRVRYRFEGERSCVTLADPAALRQVFWNVLLNAIQALEERDERRVEARCRAESGECRIEIRDSGPGITPDERERVFEVFHSTRPGGSGFGLAIARQIVSRHDGSISIDSLDGWGCVVKIRFPLRVGEHEGKGESHRT